MGRRGQQKRPQTHRLRSPSPPLGTACDPVASAGFPRGYEKHLPVASTKMKNTYDCPLWGSKGRSWSVLCLLGPFWGPWGIPGRPSPPRIRTFGCLPFCRPGVGRETGLIFFCLNAPQLLTVAQTVPRDQKPRLEARLSVIFCHLSGGC